MTREQREQIGALLDEYVFSLLEFGIGARPTRLDRLTPALSDARKSIDAALDALTAEHEASARDTERYRAAIYWALGYEDFAERRPGQGAYWWRKELAERAGQLADFSVARAATRGEGTPR